MKSSRDRFPAAGASGAPGRAGSGASGAPDWAERMVRFLDDGFTVPGTKFRVGFDAVLGLVPGVGDVVTTASSVALLWVAWKRDLPYPVMARMVGNLAIDAIVGAVPIVGDLFDVVFKANRRNLDLIEQHTGGRREVSRSGKAFLILLGAAVLSILVASVLLSIVLLRALLS
jgi:hypothetical protein